ncbi:PDZ domain-containing protein [Planctomycetota bacterium]
MFSRSSFIFRLLLLGMSGLPVQGNDDLFDQEEAAMRTAVETVAPSVVRIETFATIDRLAQVAGTGPTTGLIVSEEGYVLSSAFNFVSKPESILVTLYDGTRLAASIHARDTSRQLVLLRLEQADDVDLVVPRLTPLAKTRVGQWAIAVGRTLNVDQPNISVGIVSATDRIWGKAIQTDAKISPNNYGGPMIDLNGHVMGILAPLSPQGGSEFAGTEWYDSGIGFAVPIHGILERLDVLKKGNDLKTGLMGISLKGNDLFGSAAEIGVCRMRTPAYESGLRAGDVITSVNGLPIERQSQLKHALGPLYAAETIDVVVKRDDKNVEATVTLTDKIEPYGHPFVGILPRRDSEGCVVRFVYPDSPAAIAEVRSGDRITHVDDFEIKNTDGLREHIASLEDEQQVVIKLTRDGTEKSVTLTLADLPTKIPAELPDDAEIKADDSAPTTGTVEVTLPEEAGTCFAFIPENYDPRVEHGLLVDIAEPGKFSKEEFESKWASLAASNRLIVIAPQPKDEKQWLPTESEFIRKTVEAVTGSYSIDVDRVALLGHRSGGSMAMLTTRRNRELVRALALVDSSISVGRDVVTDPANRLAIYCALAAETKNLAEAKTAIKFIKNQRFPVTEIDLGQQSRPLSDGEREALCRWIDSLDRI